MPLDIAKLTVYQQAKDVHTGAVAAARAANDEVAEIRADLEFERAKSSIREQAETQAEQIALLQSAVEQAKEKYPLVPAELYEGLTEPQTVLAAAEKAGAAIEAQIAARAGAAPAVAAGAAWPRPAQGGTPPAPNRNPADYANPDPEYIKDLNRRLQDPKTRKEQRDAADELAQGVFRAKVLTRFDKFTEAQQQGQQQ